MPEFIEDNDFLMDSEEGLDSLHRSGDQRRKGMTVWAPHAIPMEAVYKAWPLLYYFNFDFWVTEH